MSLESGLSNIPVEQIRDNVKEFVLEVADSLIYGTKIKEDAVQLLDRYLDFRDLPTTNKTKYQLPVESKTAIQFAGALVAIAAQRNGQEVYTDTIRDATFRNGKLEEFYNLIRSLPAIDNIPVKPWNSLHAKKK